MTAEAWRRPIGMSDAGACATLLDRLPADAGGAAEIVQGLLLHQFVAPAYGVALDAGQQAEPHLRGVAAMLGRLAERDRAPIGQARPPAERLVCVCRHFTLLHVALLRRHGVSARARCGFGAYFQPGQYLDHWVTEYFDEQRQRWVLVDAQLDGRQRELFAIDFDPLDVPRDRFVVAGDAWQLAQSGAADPARFGILDMRGLWFIASNVIRDIAALNNHEMLPWDVWGGMVREDALVDRPFIDRLAGLSRAPDDDPAALRAAYQDARVAVPSTVFNAVLLRPENVD